MQDWAGWLLVLFSFSIVLMWKRIRSDTKVVYAIWFCMVFHHAVVLLNAYVCTVIGAEHDASQCHSKGVLWATLPEPEWVYGSGQTIYIQFLGFFYRAFGASLFFGGELSVLSFALSCVVLVKLVDLLELRHFRVGIVLFFGLLPSTVIYGSVTLREPWQALFFLLCVYWAVRLRKRPNILIVSFLIMSVFCLAHLHHGLARYAVYFIVLSIYWGVFARKKGVRWARHARFLFAGLLGVCAFILAKKLGWFMTIGQVLEVADGYRQAAASVDARTTYDVVLDMSSVLGCVYTIPMVLVHYMFAPFPWQVENAKDIIALLEAMLRFVLLYFAFSSWRRSSGEVRSYYSFLLIAVLGMEFMWALGTVNWGTATRHHLPGSSVFVLLGAPGLILFMRKIHFGIFGRGKASIFQDREKFVKPDAKTDEML